MDLKPIDWSKVECSFVYCYLRQKDQTPYYIGLASRRDRITGPHRVHIPPDRNNIRVLKSGLTREEACLWERRYIAHYGRKDLGTGILQNQTNGGEEGAQDRVVTDETRRKLSIASKGRPVSEEAKAKISAANKGNFTPEQHVALTEARERKSIEVANQYGIEVEPFLALNPDKRKIVLDRVKYGGFKPEDLMKDLDGENRYERGGLRQKLGAAEKYGIDPEVYLALSDRHRQKVAERYSSGMRGERLMQHLDLDMRTAQSLERYECTLEHWNSLTTKQKANVGNQWRRGKRGADLFYQLPDS